jgi:hypothetical protein
VKGYLKEGNRHTKGRDFMKMKYRMCRRPRAGFVLTKLGEHQSNDARNPIGSFCAEPSLSPSLFVVCPGVPGFC